MVNRSGWLSRASGLALSRVASGWVVESMRFTLLGQMHRGNCARPNTGRLRPPADMRWHQVPTFPRLPSHDTSSPTTMRHLLVDQPKTRGFLIALGTLVLLIVL